MIAALIVAVSVAVAAAMENAEMYKCSLCISSVDRFIDNASHPATFADSCKLAFPLDNSDFCSILPENKQIKVIAGDSRQTCIEENFCPRGPESWETFKHKKAFGNNLDIRVSKAIGSRGYNKVRVSVLSNHTISSDLFSYSNGLKYRWASNSVSGNLILNTGIVTVTPGKINTFNIDGTSVDISIPAENTGVRGIIVADPCFQSQWISCAYKDKFSTFERTTELLNAAMEFGDMNFFQILGDNFYDQTGESTAAWFNALSTKTKSTILATVPGNHDFWVQGGPLLATSKDQNGNGFMQFYGQDVLASKASEKADPFDFSVDPDVTKGGLPVASNFFFYNKVGNVAMIGFSGAHPYKDQTLLFDEACSWAASSNSDVVLLLTHWNTDGLGCDSSTTAPAVYKELAARPACAPIASKMKYFMGHTHCNLVTEKDVGYMVAAMGMESTSTCPGTFGFPVVDTTGGTFKVYNFPLMQTGTTGSFDNYQKILDCVKGKGFSGCYSLAEQWTSVAL